MLLLFLIVILVKGEMPQLKLYAIGVLLGALGWWRFRRKVLEDREFYSRYFSMSEKERKDTPLPEHMLIKKEDVFDSG